VDYDGPFSDNGERETVVIRLLAVQFSAAKNGNSSDEMKSLVWLDECASQELVARRMARHLELVVFVLETLISSL
jgi:hypothetical protein